MSETPPEEVMDLDTLFGTEQTDQARLEVTISYSAMHNGKPLYPKATYGDAPRVAVIPGEEGEEPSIYVETDADLRFRVINSALQAAAESHQALVEGMSTTNRK